MAQTIRDAQGHEVLDEPHDSVEETCSCGNAVPTGDPEDATYVEDGRVICASCAERLDGKQPALPFLCEQMTFSRPRHDGI